MDDFVDFDDLDVVLGFEPPEYFENFQYVIEKSKLASSECIFSSDTELALFGGVNGAVELVSKGWDKEAIPTKYKKKSLISGFFSRLFN